MFKSLLAAIVLVRSALALTSPPSGALTVGANGKYHNIQDAVNALDEHTKDDQTIFIYSGIYREQVIISKLKGSLTIYGESASEAEYIYNTVTILSHKSQADGLDNDGTATLAVHTSNFFMYNVNVANTYGQGSQLTSLPAVALSAAAKGNLAFYACQFTGYQDTLYARKGTQIYVNCYVEGATDFIFGRSAIAWFENCTIAVLSAEKGYITANGRSTSDGYSYYVINNSKIVSAIAQTVLPGAYYLGRPWGSYARVVFQNSQLSDVVNKEGWSEWHDGDERTDDVEFGEFNNSGDGASPKSRASFSKQLSNAVRLSEVIPDYTSWADNTFVT